MPPVQERQLWGQALGLEQRLGAGQSLYLCLCLRPPRLVQELLRGQRRR